MDVVESPIFENVPSAIDRESPGYHRGTRIRSTYPRRFLDLAFPAADGFKKEKPKALGLLVLDFRIFPLIERFRFTSGACTAGFEPP
ncbi:MAG: hypothetical protein ACK53L_35180, partial [Pirellulaceae bacterium]